MKKVLLAFSAFTLLFAFVSCVPEDNNPSWTGDGGGDKTVLVTGITLDKSSIVIKEGESVTLIATVDPENADNTNVAWASSDVAVATVDASGRVTGVKAGSATITATAEDGGMKATCSVSVETNLAPSLTIDANHISAISALLAGRANLGSTVAVDLQVGFQYSTSVGILPSNSITVEASDADADYNYSTGITGLEPGTTYYFRSFVRQNNQYTYGETKSFTTKDILSLMETKDASVVEATSALLNAKLDLTDVQYKSLAYGFLWGTSEPALNTDVKCTEIEDNAFSVVLTGLSHQTQYWFKAYVRIDSQTFYGEVKTFTTSVVPVESVSLDKAEYSFHAIDDILTLTATVLPYDATDKSIEWISSNADVASVDQTGKVTATGNGISTITVTTKDQGKTATCTITVTQYIMGITLDKGNLSLKPGERYSLEVSISPANAYDKTLSWTSSNEAVATVDANGVVSAIAVGSSTITSLANDGSGKQATCSVSVYPPYTAIPGDAIDLGLSVKWSSCNLGATKPEEYGDYFAWGEIEPHYTNGHSYDSPCENWWDDNTGYNWESYQWCDGSVYTLTKYNTSASFGIVDNNVSFKDYDYADDAARSVLGSTWRIPTETEWTELKNNCKCIWTWNYNSTGVSGLIVTSNVDGYRDKRIFLPAAGDRVDADILDNGSWGDYWSSSTEMGYPFVGRSFGFYSDSVYVGGFERYVGLPIRAVTE